MKETTIIFTLNEVNTTIKCSKNDKMDDICLKYSKKINKDKDNLLFLYKGKNINFDLNYNEQANDIDKDNHEMKLLVFEKENYLKCNKCGEKLKFNKDNIHNIHNIILNNNIINDNINKIKIQIKTMVENCFINENKIRLHNINKMLIAINEDIIKNNENLINLLNCNCDTINNNISINKNNNIDNENNIKNELDIKLNKLDKNVDISNKCKIKENCINLNESKLYEKIKSKLINKIIFSNLNETIKLKAIKYNKKLQKDNIIKTSSNNSFHIHFFSLFYIHLQKIAVH